jgi:hypothetical protein
LSLALFALGGADPTSEFYLITLSFVVSSAIVGLVLDTIVVSCDVEGMPCEELGWHVSSCLSCPFIALVRACRVASTGVTPRGYKVGGCPCTRLCPLAQPLIASSPRSLWLKRKRDREEKQGRELLSLQGVASPSLLSHGGEGLDHVGGHTRASAKPHESRVHDDDRAHDLRRARESCIPCAGWGNVVECVAFYEQGFGVPSHKFLCSLL